MKKLILLMLAIGLLFSSCEKDSINQNSKLQKNKVVNEQFDKSNLECGACDGKINELVLLYIGNQNATVKVETKKNGENGSKIVFNQNLQPNETFSFVGNDKKGTLGTEITIFINGAINTKIHTSCSVPVGPGMISGDFEVISGSSRNGGNLCPIVNDDDDTTPNPEDCNDCEGKINQLELLYNGSVSATIVVETKKVGENGSKIVFNDFVQPGETFSFVGNDKKGTLGTQITIFINGEINTKIHTSCSVPVGPRMISGDFEVISGSSRIGGDLCPLETEPNNDCPCDGNIISMTVIYDGPNGGTLNVGIKNDGSDTLQVFNNVLQGDILTISIGDVGEWWYFSVNGSVDASIHTSCSDIITGNINATISDFGSLGYFANPLQGIDNATFYIINHTDNSGNTCSANAG